jgi:hypothetical protein
MLLKQKVSDIVDPVTFVQADQNGQFGGVRMTVPDSVSLGTLMIQAMERQGSLTAVAAATVTRADDPQVGTQVGTAVTIATAGITVTPNATAMASLTLVRVLYLTTYWNKRLRWQLGDRHVLREPEEMHRRECGALG